MVSTTAESENKDILIETTGGNITLNPEQGSDYVINSVGGATITNSYNGDATDSKGNITLNGKVQAVDAVSISATNGDITVDDVASSGSTVAIETTTGNITLDGTGSSKSGTTVKVLSEGDVNVTGALTTTGTGTDLGNVEVSTPKGSITLKGKQNEAGETPAVIDTTGTAFITTTYTGAYNTTDGTLKTLGDITITGDVKAAKAAQITSTVGDLSIAGNVDSATGTTVQTSSDGTITVTGKLSTTNTASDKAGAVNVSTTGDNITLAADSNDKGKDSIVSAGAVNVTAQGGTISVQGDVQGAGAVGVTTTGEGTITIGSNNGTVTPYGVSSTGSTTNVSTGTGDITLYGTASSATGTTIQSTSGNISVTGALNTSSASGATGDVEATTSGTISLTKASDDAPDVVTSTGGVTLQTTNSTDYNAETTAGNITISGNVKAAGTTQVTTNTGDISVTGGLQTTGATASTSGISVTTQKGNITLDGGMTVENHGTIALNTAAGAATVTAGKDYSITLKGGSLVGGALKLSTTGKGTIDVNKPVKKALLARRVFKAPETVTNYNGTKGASVDISTDTGAIDLGGTFTATEKGVSVTSTSGTITLNGALLTDANATGSVLVQTQGDISLTVADGNTDVLKSSQGNVTVQGYTGIGADKAGEGDITLNGNVTAAQAVQILTNGTGNDAPGTITIGNNGAVTITGGTTTNIESNIGAITLYGKATSQTGTTVKANTSGDITINGTVSTADQDGADGVAKVGDVLVQTQNSKINFVKTTDYPDSINSSGDVTVSSSDDSKDVTTDEAGDITIGSDVKGAKDVTISTSNGSITVGVAGSGNEANISAVEDASLSTTTAGDITVHGAVESTGTKASNGVTGDASLSTATGAITVDSAVNSAGGAVSVTNTTGVITLGTNGNTGNVVSGATTATITSTDSAINVTGNIVSGTGTKVQTNNTTDAANITVNGSLQTTTQNSNSDVLVQTAKGDISLGNANVTNAVSSAGAVTVKTTTEGDITVTGGTGAVQAANTAELNATSGYVQVAASQTALMSNGKATIQAASSSYDTGSDLAAGDVSILGGVSSEKDAVLITTNYGDITIGSSIAPAEVSAATALDVTTTAQGNVNVNGILETEGTSAGALTVKATEGNVTLTKGGDFANDVVNSGGSVSITATDSDTDGDDAAKGNITIAGDVIGDTSVTISTDQGNIVLGTNATNYSAVQAGTTLGVSTTKAGNVTVNGSLVTEGTNAGALTVKATDGKVTLTKAGKAAETATDATEVVNSGNSVSISATDSETAEDTVGDIAITGNVIGATSVAISTDQGNINLGTDGTNYSAVKAGTTLGVSTTKAGNVTVNGSLVTEGTNAGALTVKATDGKVTLNKAGSGVTDVVNSGNSVSITASDSDAAEDTVGDIAITGNVVGVTSVAISTDQGNIEVGTGNTAETLSAVKAGTTLNVATNTKGNVTVNGSLTTEGTNAGALTVKATDGKVTLNKAGSGVTDVVNSGNSVSITASDSDAAEDTVGNIAITGNVIGATSVAISTDQGNIELGTSGADGVATAVQAGTTLGVSTTTAGNVTVNGSLKTAAVNGSTVGDVTVSAAEGKVTLTAAGTEVTNVVDSGAAVSITASDSDNNDTNQGNIDVSGNILAAKAATLTATNGALTLTGDLTAKDGQAKLEASNSGTYTTGTHATPLAGDVLVKGDVTSEKANVVITTDSGDITLGTDTTTNSSAVQAATTLGVSTTTAGNVTVNGSLKTAAANGSTVGDVTVTATEGKVTLTKADSAANVIDSGKDIVVTAINVVDPSSSDTEGDIDINSGLKAAGAVTVHAYKADAVATSKGDINIDGNVTAGTAVDIAASTGNVTIGGTTAYNVQAGTGLAVKTLTDGDVAVTGQLVTTGADASTVTVQATEGNVTLTKSGSADEVIKSAKDVSISASDNGAADENVGDILVKGNITGATSVAISTDQGDITLGTNDAPTAVKAGTNLGVSTTKAGDVTVNGSLTTVSTNNSTVGDVTVTATEGKVTLTKAGDATNVIDSGKDIVVTAINVVDPSNSKDEGDIDINSSLNAAGAVTVHAYKLDGTASGTGDITLDGAVTAGTAVDIAANTGNVTIGGTTASKVQAGTTLAVKTLTDGDVAVTGQLVTTGADASTVTVSAKDGNVTLTKDGSADEVIKSAKDVSISASDSGAADENVGDILVKGNITGATAVAISTDQGDITLGTNEAATAVKAGTTLGVSTTKAGNITVNGSLVTEQGADLLNKVGDVTVSAAEGKVTLNKAGDGVDDVVNSGAAVSITASDEKESGTDADYDGDITVDGNITAATAATLESTNGALSLTGNLTANNGLAKIAASDSEADNPQNADTVGDITVKGNVTSAKAGVEISTSNGDIALGTNTPSTGAVAITAATTTNIADTNGDITLYGTATSQTGTTVKTITSGDITVNGTLETKDQDGGDNDAKVGDVQVLAAKGNITLTNTGNDVVNSSKAALVQTGAGDIDVTGNVIGATTATLDGKEGHVNLTGNLTANNGLAKIQAYDEAEAAESNDDGNITVKGNVVSDTDGVTITTTNGDITVGTAEATPGAVKAVKALEISTAGTGDVTVNGNLKTTGADYGTVTVTATEGKVTLNKYGNVAGTTATVADYVIDSAKSVSVQAIDAKTDVGGTDDGNITVNGDVKAITTAKVSTDNGDITVGATGAAVTLEAGSDLTVEATESSNINVTGELLTTTGGKGNISVTTEQGAVSLTKGGTNPVVSSDGSVTITAADTVYDEDTDGNVTIKGDVTGKTSVAITTNYGDITVGTGTPDGVPSAVSAGTTLDVKTTKQGNVTVNGSLTTAAVNGSEVGDVTVSAAEGKVSLNKTTATGDDVINSGAAVSITASDAGDTDDATLGDIDIVGNVIGATSVDIHTDRGDIQVGTSETNYSAVKAGTALNVATNTTGDVTVNGNLKTTGADYGTVTVTATEGKVTLNKYGSVAGTTTPAADYVIDSANSVSVTASDKDGVDNLGNINVNGDVKAITTAEISTDNGDITVGATGAAVTLEAGSDLTVEATESGNIDVTGELLTTTGGKGNISVTTEQGAVSLTKGSTNPVVSSDGSVTITAADDSYDTDTDGNVTIQGDVKALTTAEISTDNGDITVGATGAAVTLEAGSNLTVQTTSQGDIDVTGKLVTTKDGKGNISVLTPMGNISLNNGTGNTADKVVDSDGSLTVHTYVDNGTSDKHEYSGIGDIDIDGSLSANGAIDLGVNTGNSQGVKGIDVNGTTTAGGTITMETLSDGAIATHGAVESTAGSVNQTGNGVLNGSINNASTVKASTDVVESAATTLTNSGAVTATTGKVDLDAGGNITNSSTVTGKTAVTMDSTGGNIANTGKVKSETSTVTLNATSTKADTGAITNSAGIEAGTGITLTAGNQITNSSTEEIKTAAGNIAMTSTNMGITNEGALSAIGSKGTITLTAENKTNGNITNEEDVTADGNITMTAGHDLVNNGEVKSINGKVELNAGNDQFINDNVNAESINIKATGEGDIHVGSDTKAVTLQSQSTTTLQTENGDITLYGLSTSQNDTTIEATKSGNIAIHGEVMTADADDTDDVVNTGNVLIKTAEGNITLDPTAVASPEDKKVVYDQPLVSSGSVAVQSLKGNVDVTDDVTAATSAELSAANGSVDLKGNLEAKDGTAKIAATDTDADGNTPDTLGNVNIQGNVTSDKANVIISASNGTITAGTAANEAGEGGKDVAITAATTTVIENTNGDITLYGTATSQNGTTVHTITDGDITVKGQLTTADVADGKVDTGDVQVLADNGTITLDNGTADAISSTSDAVVHAYTNTGTVEKPVYAGEGDVAITGKVIAAKTADIGTYTGDVSVTGNVQSANGTTVEVKDSGTLGVTGKLSTTAEDGDVRVLTNTGKLSLTAAEGDETATAIDSKGDVLVQIMGAAADPATDILDIQGNVTAADELAVKSNNSNIKVGDGTTETGYTLTGTDTTISSTTGAIDVYGALSATSGDVLVETQGKVGLTSGVTGKPVVKSTGGDAVLRSYTLDNQGKPVASTGTLTVNGDVTADQAVSLKSDTGKITFTGTATSETGTTLQALTSGDIEVTGKLVTADTENTNKGDVKVLTKDGDITLTKTKDGVDVVSSSQAALVQTEDGSVSVTGNVTGATTAALEAADGNVTLKGDLLAKNGQAKLETSDSSTGENEVGDILVEGNVTSSAADVLVTTKNGNITVGDANKQSILTGATGVAVNTDTNGDITVKGQLITDPAVTGSKTPGSVSVTTDTGSITLQSNEADAPVINSGADATVQASTEGDITVSDDITAAGKVLVDTKKGAVNVGAEKAPNTITAGNTAAVQSQEGDVTVYGTVTSPNGTTVQTLENGGNVTVTGLLETTAAEGDVNVTATKGLVTLNQVGDEKNVISTAGDATVKATADTYAAGADKDGSINLNGDVTAKDGAVQVTTNKGDIAVGKVGEPRTITAGTTAAITTTTQGDVTVTGTVTSKDGTTVETLDKGGDVAVTGQLVTTGTGDVVVKATEGKATLNKNSSNAPVITSGGNALVTATDLGETAEAVGDVEITGDIKATQSVAVHAYDLVQDGDVYKPQGEGNVAVTGDLNAGTTINLGTNSGNVTYKGTATSQSGTTLEAITSGDVAATGELITAKGGNGDVRVTTGEGQVTLTKGEAGNPVVNSDAAVVIAAADTAYDDDGDGDITVAGDVVAGTTATISTNNGDIAVGTAATTDPQAAAVPVTITSGSDLTVKTTNQGNIGVTGELVTNDGGKVSVTTKTGDITLDNAGKDKAIDSAAGVLVETTTQGDVAVTGDVLAGTDAELSAAEGSVDLKGDLTANGGDAAILASEKDGVDANKGNVTVTGNVTGSNAASITAENGNVNFTGDLTGTAGNATIKASDNGADDSQGNIVLDGNATAGKDLSITTDHGTITAGKESADTLLTGGNTTTVQNTVGDIAIQGKATSATGTTVASAQEGNVDVKGQLETTGAGDVKVTTGTGNIDLTNAEAYGPEAIKSGKDALVQTATGDITVTGDTDTKGAATFETQTQGNVNYTGDIQSGTAATLDAQSGNVDLNGSVDSGTETVLQAAGGNVTQTGDHLTAGTGITASATEGSVDLTTKVTAQNGNVKLTASDTGVDAQKGNIQVTGPVVAKGGSVNAVTDNGNINYTSTVQADKDLTAQTQNGDIHYAADIQSGGNLSAETTQSGNITLDSTAQAGQNVDLKADQQGNITLRKDITGGSNVNLATNNGSILFEGNNPDAVEMIHVTSQNGDVNLTTTGTGDITDHNRQPNGDQGYVQAPAGNISINHSGSGDVDLYSLKALQKVGVEVKDGNLYLDTVDGKPVALFVRNPEKTMDVGNVNAGQEVDLSGSDIGVDKITQRQDSDGYIVFDVKGAQDNKPVEYLQMDDIQTSVGARFKQLWLRNGSITATKGKLDIDKLYVLDKVYFSNGVMKTQVYGTLPIPDETMDSTYWNNVKLNDPASQLDRWLDTGNVYGKDGKWMYLHFDAQGNTQYSNGNLVELREHNYVYPQRYSVVEVMGLMQDQDSSNFWTVYLHPEISLADRYDLMDVTAAVSMDLEPARVDIVVEQDQEQDKEQEEQNQNGKKD